MNILLVNTNCLYFLYLLYIFMHVTTYHWQCRANAVVCRYLLCTVDVEIACNYCYRQCGRCSLIILFTLFRSDSRYLCQMVSINQNWSWMLLDAIFLKFAWTVVFAVSVFYYIYDFVIKTCFIICNLCISFRNKRHRMVFQQQDPWPLTLVAKTREHCFILSTKMCF